MVWRPAGVSAQRASRRRAGSPGRASRRPRRARRSATWPRSRWPCLARSISRPGVPTTTSTPLLQRLDLRLVGATAVDGEHADAARLAGPLEVAGDLHGELAGRDDDEGLRLAGDRQRRRSRRPWGTVTRLQHRDAEAEGLAGAGLGLADDVVAGQGDREGHRLDRERAGDAVRRRAPRRCRGGWGSRRTTRPGTGSVTVSGTSVASVTSVMGLFRSAGARRASAGAVGRSEVFGGRAASGTPGARHIKELGSSCRPGTVGRSPLYR